MPASSIGSRLGMDGLHADVGEAGRRRRSWSRPRSPRSPGQRCLGSADERWNSLWITASARRTSTAISAEGDLRIAAVELAHDALGAPWWQPVATITLLSRSEPLKLLWMRSSMVHALSSWKPARSSRIALTPLA